MKTLLKKAGYYVEITSWENDADNYKTYDLHCKSKEEAQFLFELAKKHSSCNSSKGGLGNTMDYDEISEKTISEISEIFKQYKNVISENDFNFEKLNIDKNINKEFLLEIVKELCTYSLFSYSEYYCFRVFDKGKIYFLENDVFIDVIEQASR